MMAALDLILASSSRYRAQLLGRLGLPFRQVSPDCDESALANETPGALAERLAHSKAQAVADICPSALVVGSDQVAELGGDKLGKPGSEDAAQAQLARCSGQVVRFHTALCVLDRESVARAVVDMTQVHFRELTAQEIQRYIEAEQPLDCAGSFKCEGLGISLFERIESQDPTALIGLPLIALARILRACGVALP